MPVDGTGVLPSPGVTPRAHASWATEHAISDPVAGHREGRATSRPAILTARKSARLARSATQPNFVFQFLLPPGGWGRERAGRNDDRAAKLDN